MLIIIIYLSLALSIFAGDEYIVIASYRYVVPENISLSQAKLTALDRAKIQAIEEKFGTVVSQSNSTIIQNENGNTNSKFLSFGGSQIKGEWIETIEQPEYIIETNDGITVISVTVKGKIKSISRSKIDFEVRVLRNGTGSDFESSEFKNGNDLYVYFQSPVDGYLSVYLVDEENAFCLLPYKRQRDGIFKIEANKEYILFNKKVAGNFSPQIIDEYVMNCGALPESNMIYVLFSQNKFNKTVDKDIERYSPRVIPLDKFHQWIEKQNKTDIDFNIRQIPIIIRP